MLFLLMIFSRLFSLISLNSDIESKAHFFQYFLCKYQAIPYLTCSVNMGVKNDSSINNLTPKTVFKEGGANGLTQLAITYGAHPELCWESSRAVRQICSLITNNTYSAI